MTPPRRTHSFWTALAILAGTLAAVAVFAFSAAAARGTELSPGTVPGSVPGTAPDLEEPEKNEQTFEVLEAEEPQPVRVAPRYAG